MIPENVYRLAQFAVEKVGLRGIDWSELQAKGKGSVWVSNYLSEYMIPAQTRMNVAVGQLSLAPGGDVSDYNQKYAVSESTIADIAGTIVGIAGVTQATRVSVQMSREATRYLVTQAYAAASYGALLHYDETIHHRSGISDAEIATHANLVVGTMNALVMLDSLGFYTALGLRKTQAQSGLGAAQVVIGAVVVAVFALALLAWLIVNLVNLSKTSKIVANMCEAAQASGDAAATAQCINTLTDKNKAIGTAVPDQIKAALFAVLPYALAGVAVYGLFLSAPYIIKSIATNRS